APEENYDWMEKEFGTHPHKSGAFVLKLEDDMVTVREEPREIEITDCRDGRHLFFEASSLRKINDLYYFIYSSFYSHELCYATSASPAGPFRYRGILHDNGDIGLNGITEENRVSYTGNNHGSLVELNGNWYIFGHRPTNYSVFARQGIAERVYISDDGFIPQAEMTSCGLNGGPLKPEGKYGAFMACCLKSAEGALHYLDNCKGPGFEGIRDNHPAFSQDGDDREDNPNQYIKNLREGSICGFKYFSYVKNTHIRVTTRGAGGIFEIRTSPLGKVIAEIPLTEKQEYHESVPVKVIFPKCDKLALYFTYRGYESVDFLSFEFC
ncbi:MAG: family 43 glycosylhydrolase, partial [Erysipelotrichaceae bacterium]|nr:family 43 glycosylhydrolase [Erysipelotrichaceae bacterium]